MGSYCRNSSRSRGQCKIHLHVALDSDGRRNSSRSRGQCKYVYSIGLHIRYYVVTPPDPEVSASRRMRYSLGGLSRNSSRSRGQCKKPWGTIITSKDTVVTPPDPEVSASWIDRRIVNLADGRNSSRSRGQCKAGRGCDSHGGAS